jgi:hypothetical protein
MSQGERKTKTIIYYILPIATSLSFPSTHTFRIDRAARLQWYRQYAGVEKRRNILKVEFG